MDKRIIHIISSPLTFESCGNLIRIKQGKMINNLDGLDRIKDSSVNILGIDAK